MPLSHNVKQKTFVKLIFCRCFFLRSLCRMLHFVGCFTLSDASLCRMKFAKSHNKNNKPPRKTTNKAKPTPHPPYICDLIDYLTPSINFYRTTQLLILSIFLQITLQKFFSYSIYFLK